MTGRIVFLSAGRSGAFLKWAWTNRSQLSPLEREGLAQAIFASLLGHIEAVMYEVLVAEYQRTMSAINGSIVDGSQPAVLQARGVSLSLMMSRLGELEKQTFEPLFKELDLIFSPRFSAGPKQHKDDLDAIRDLRNVFVHGRALSLPLAASTGVTINLDKNQLQKVVLRLRAAKVLSQADTVTQGQDLGGDESRLFKLLHSDAAVLHFVGIGRTFQAELHQLSSYPAEIAGMNMFPDLVA